MFPNWLLLFFADFLVSWLCLLQRLAVITLAYSRKGIIRPRKLPRDFKWVFFQILSWHGGGGNGSSYQRISSTALQLNYQPFFSRRPRTHDEPGKMPCCDPSAGESSATHRSSDCQRHSIHPNISKRATLTFCVSQKRKFPGSQGEIPDTLR